jgi:hypothetical protein
MRILEEWRIIPNLIYLEISNLGKVRIIGTDKFYYPNKKHKIRSYYNGIQNNFSFYSALFSSFGVKYDPKLDTITNKGEYILQNINIQYFDFTKVCSNCNILKSLDYFHNRKGGKFGKSERCQLCSSSQGKDYYKDNKISVDIKNKRNYNNNKERHLSYGYRWKKDNKHKYLPKHNMRCTQRKITYKTHSEIFKFDEIDRVSVYNKARELTLITGIKHEVDHIVPLKGKNVCGLHVSWNMQVLTKSQNASKGNRI